jgi:hypothetical protein
MSSSSRSIAAARQKRAGEQSQQINTSRPVTSISSQAAFAQQYQQQRMPQNTQIGGKNVRVTQNRNQESSYQTSQQASKISVSNAVGLITLRLGKLEQMINELHFDGGSANINVGANNMLPSDMKLVSDEVFENIVNRLNLLESKILNSKNMDDYIEKIDNETNEMKNVIANLHNTLFNFINETNEKFIDYENALALIEENNQLNISTTNNNTEVIENTQTNEIDKTNENIVLENIE